MKTPVQGLVLGLLWSALCLGGGAVPASANDWEQIGITARPPWVAGTVERRLPLVDSLKGIEDDLVSEATGYIGGHGPGLSVGLTLTDGLYYSRGFGFRDAAKTKTPGEFTVFCIGSFTKVFTGTALLALRDAGELSLEDPD